MDNASTILRTLDARLDHSVRLVLYGRAALQLGFNGAPPEVARSKDVDAIIPIGDIATFDDDIGFWDAQAATNDELRPRGLYIMHLFPADMVFLRRNWEDYLVLVTRPETRWLRLFRPATVDLVLTKMMRGADPQDMADARFLVEHDDITRAQLEQAFSEVVLPDLVELRDAFAKARPLVLAMGR